jgi:hypothetical protein
LPDVHLGVVHAALKRGYALDLIQLVEKHLAENARRPPSEKHALHGLDAVSNGDDDIQVVEPDRAPAAIFMQNLHKIPLVNLALVDSVPYMAGYDRLVTSEQPAHLFLCQPYGLAVSPDVNAHIRAVIVNDDLTC